MKTMITFFLVISAACAGTCGCNSLFYYPSSKTYTEDIAEKHEERFLASRSGNRIHMLYFPAENPKALIVHFHGNARNISAHHKAFLWAVPHGYDLISWDYSGYGQSTGSAGRRELQLDSLTMLDYAVRQKERRGYPLIVIGQSLGGAVLLGALEGFEERNKVDFLMVDCTFPSYVELGNFHIKNTTCLPIPLCSAIVTDEFAPASDYASLRDIPILVTHCREDEVVPFFLGEKLFARLENRRKWFWELSCKHTAGFWRKENQLRLLAFFEGEAIGKGQ